MEDNSFLGHLEELRKVILRSLAVVAALFPFSWWAAGRLIPFLTASLLPQGFATLHYFSPMEAFIAELKMGAIISFALAFPYVAWQFWQFVAPALYKNEKKVLGKAVIFSSLLFIAGAAFVYFAILPILMRFAFSFASPHLRPVFGLANFLSLAGGLMLAGGLVFQLPLATVILDRFGLVDRDKLKKARPYVVVILLILAALATPPDVVSQLLLFAPAYALFELGVLFTRPAPKE